jgi:hypothetical protein
MQVVLDRGGVPLPFLAVCRGAPVPLSTERPEYGVAPPLQLVVTMERGNVRR